MVGPEVFLSHHWLILDSTFPAVGWSWIHVKIQHMADGIVMPTTGTGDQPAGVTLHHFRRHLHNTAQ
jgi:hypothetical protein